MVGVVCHIEAKEKAHVDRLLATTEELEKAQSRIRSMEQEMQKTREEEAKLVLEGLKQLESVAPMSV